MYLQTINLVRLFLQVDENMAKAQKRSAVTKEVFWFRTDLTMPKCNDVQNNCQSAGDASGSKSTGSSSDENVCCADPTNYAQMSINDIINGKVSISC